VSLIRDLFTGGEKRYLTVPLDPTPEGAYTGNGWGAGMVWGGFPPGGSVGAAGTEQAMRLSSVFACLRLISEAVATLPLDTFYRQGGIRKPYRPRPTYLDFQPPQQSRTSYLSQVMLSLLTDGKAFILTPRNGQGVPVDLIVLNPYMVEVCRERGMVCYKCQGHELDPETDLLHIAGMMLPGHIRGLSPIAYARETIGLGLAAQAFGSSFFTNGALPGAVIEAPERLSQEAADRFRDTWNGSHQGVGNANRIGVLTNGAKLTKVSVSPEDAQFLQTRAFQVPDVARIFGVPPHLIADASNSTSWGTGLQEQNLAFGQFSLRPWLERVEEAHSRLLTTHGLGQAFVKLNLDALLRASLKDRYEADAIGIVNGFLTINEARSFEDLPPVSWGNEPYIPTRVKPAPAPTEDGPPASPTDVVQPPPQPSAPVGGKP
jgi:HK97 family phage portal protein